MEKEVNQPAEQSKPPVHMEEEIKNQNIQKEFIQEAKEALNSYKKKYHMIKDLLSQIKEKVIENNTKLKEEYKKVKNCTKEKENLLFDDLDLTNIDLANEFENIDLSRREEDTDPKVRWTKKLNKWQGWLDRVKYLLSECILPTEHCPETYKESPQGKEGRKQTPEERKEEPNRKDFQYVNNIEKKEERKSRYVEETGKSDIQSGSTFGESGYSEPEARRAPAQAFCMSFKHLVSLNISKSTYSKTPFSDILGNRELRGADLAWTSGEGGRQEVFITGGYRFGEGEFRTAIKLKFNDNNKTVAPTQELPDMKYARAWHSLLLVRDTYLYALGGSCGYPTIKLSSCERFNTRTDTWISLPSLTVPRNSMTVFTRGNFLYAFGGRDGEGYSVDLIERLDITHALEEDRIWENIDLRGDNILIGGNNQRRGLGNALVVNTPDSILIFGGASFQPGNNYPHMRSDKVYSLFMDEEDRETRVVYKPTLKLPNSACMLGSKAILRGNNIYIFGRHLSHYILWTMDTGSQGSNAKWDSEQIAKYE